MDDEDYEQHDNFRGQTFSEWQESLRAGLDKEAGFSSRKFHELVRLLERPMKAAWLKGEDPKEWWYRRRSSSKAMRSRSIEVRPYAAPDLKTLRTDIALNKVLARIRKRK